MFTLKDETPGGLVWDKPNEPVLGGMYKLTRKSIPAFHYDHGRLTVEDVPVPPDSEVRSAVGDEVMEFIAGISCPHLASV
jgi:hypothetical protein